eukprot:317406-Pelagomonas_calceolata.AAC.2
MSAPQRKLMSGMILTKPVSPCDAALAMLGISVVETSTEITFINSSRPGTKKAPFTNGDSLAGTSVQPKRKKSQYKLDV